MKRFVCLLTMLSFSLTGPEAFAEKPASFFCRDVDKLKATAVPTHFILSGYLRKSKTFDLYAKIMSQFGIEGEFLPYELPLLNGNIDSNALVQFMGVFRENPFLKSIVVSNPYKQIIIDLVDELTISAENSNAINLIYKLDEKLIGDNIDASAFLLGAQSEINFEYEEHSMLFFGCGGVSSAIACRLAPKLKKIGLVEINKQRREQLAAFVQKINPSIQVVLFDRNAPSDFSSFDILYNGTGLGKFGMDPDSLLRSPLLEGDIFPQTALAIDANYTPEKTRFIQHFEELGYKTLNGLSHMLAGTSLHLSLISEKEISYSMAKENQ